MTEKFENPLDLPSLSDAEAKARVKAKIHPKVTEDSIIARIVDVSYILLDAPGDPFRPHGTVCIITLENGWVSTGFSAPASLLNYDAAVGKRYAYDNAFKPLWQLEGYLLRNEMFHQEQEGKVAALEAGQDWVKGQKDYVKADPMPEYQRRDYSKQAKDEGAVEPSTAFAAAIGALAGTGAVEVPENPTPGVSEPSDAPASDPSSAGDAQ